MGVELGQSPLMQSLNQPSIQSRREGAILSRFGGNHQFAGDTRRILGAQLSRHGIGGVLWGNQGRGGNGFGGCAHGLFSIGSLCVE